MAKNVTAQAAGWEPSPARFPHKSENRAGRASRFPLRVVVFNAAGGGRFNGIMALLGRAPLSGAGLIMFCEAGWWVRGSRHRPFPAEVASQLGMSFAFVPEFGFPRGTVESGERKIESFYGNAIVSAEPLDEVRTVALSMPYPPERFPDRVGAPAGLIATAMVEGRAITIGLVHLDRRCDPAWRAMQIDEFLSVFPPSGPAIIAGDFNTTTANMRVRRDYMRVARQLILSPRRFRDPIAYEPLFLQLARAGFQIDGANVPGAPTFTLGGFMPRSLWPKLDWITYRGLRPVAGSAAVVPARSPSNLRRHLSDHEFITCAFEL